MTIDTENTQPTVEERYTAATNTSNLRVQAEVRGPADVIIAAGMSRSRAGAALIRLHSEWDGAAKALRPTKESIELLAEKLARACKTPSEAKRAAAGARAMAFEWYHHELGLLFQRLKTLPAVRAYLIDWATNQKLADPADKAADILRWWLHPICGTCDGQRWQVIPGTGRLSNRVCPACKGTGEADIPHGREGRALLAEMEFCLQAARSSMGARLARSRRPESDTDG